MAATLDGQSIVEPSSQVRRYGYRGAVLNMADGSQAFDLVNSNRKNVILLSWRAVTAAQLADILTGYNGLNDSGTYTDHHGTNYTVKINDLEPVEIEEISAANANRYNVSMSLREV